MSLRKKIVWELVVAYALCAFAAVLVGSAIMYYGMGANPAEQGRRDALERYEYQHAYRTTMDSLRAESP